MQVVGEGGRLMVGYKQAATLKGWSIDRPMDQPLGKNSAYLTAELLNVDRFYITQSPTKVVLVLGRVVWWWDGLENFTVNGKVLQAVLHGTPNQEA